MAVADISVPHDDVGRIVSHPSARELPGTPDAVLKVRINAGGPELRARTKRAQDQARERANRRRRAEQPRVTGDAANRCGILVVHLTADEPPAPGIPFGRRNAFAVLIGYTEPKIRRVARHDKFE